MKAELFKNRIVEGGGVLLLVLSGLFGVIGQIKKMRGAHISMKI